MNRTLLACAALLLVAPTVAAETRQTSAGAVEVEKAVSGLALPWAIAFLPEDALLITEKAGGLWYLTCNERRRVAGLPEFRVQGQGGLLDVVAARDFPVSRTIYLSYAAPIGSGAGTALARARLSDDGSRLEDLTEVFRLDEGSRRGQHFGSRIVEAPDGTLFLTVGERGDRRNAQRLDRAEGSVLRLNPDGSIPTDNPFANGGARPEIYSYGHRNPQGAALDLQGRLVISEHGPQGGDEINRPEPGRNYGWPVATYGEEYGGGRIAAPLAEGIAPPLWYWTPSIAPSGLAVYSGKLWPEWRGDLFAGSLKFDYIARLEETGTGYREAEQLLRREYVRIRDVREAPDGALWFLAEGDGAAYRMVPAGGAPLACEYPG